MFVCSFTLNAKIAEDDGDDDVERARQTVVVARRQIVCHLERREKKQRRGRFALRLAAVSWSDKRRIKGSLSIGSTLRVLTKTRAGTGGVQGNKIHSGVIWTLRIPKM